MPNSATHWYIMGVNGWYIMGVNAWYIMGVNPWYIIACKLTDNAPMIGMQFGDERFIDGVEIIQHYLCAALTAQLGSKGRSERGKARDIGKERGASCAVRERGALIECMSPVNGYKREQHRDIH